ncbi:DNA glycosylase [Kockovaella imperatae]|uniref:DNA-(apurinic or apyrimidinic site) lyase n=1 Tax=Kockovaella imperatae TaxID=4999 RepID=A0A1Y1URX4_9TREE|nr:DNA glycosylase [Kockovaella imperatae]ORX39905.1 DNA glycosylase [Kockovaella imperatae]
MRAQFPSGWSRLRISPNNLNLANTLPVGQSFLWHRRILASDTGGCREEFSRAVDDPPRVLFMRQTETDLWYTSLYPANQTRPNDDVDLPWIMDYFQLERHPSLEDLFADWRKRDPKLFGVAEVGSRAQGVRVLRQDPWECLIAFITSTNNHIPRITSLLHRLTHTFGRPVVIDDMDDGTLSYHLFPAAHEFGSELEHQLRNMGFGYRARFLESTLETLRARYGSQPGVIEAGLRDLRAADVGLARDELIQLMGVGRKVADCVLLMSLDKSSIIPIDTHMLAVASRHPSFPHRLRNKAMSAQAYDEVQTFLQDKWGPMGGWCQAVVFAVDLKERPTPEDKSPTGPEVKLEAVPEIDTAAISSIEHKETSTTKVQRKRRIFEGAAVVRHSTQTKRTRNSSTMMFKASTETLVATKVKGEDDMTK